MIDALANWSNLVGLLTDGVGVAILTIDIVPDYRNYRVARLRDTAWRKLVDISIRGLEREAGHAAPGGLAVTFDLAGLSEERAVALWTLAGIGELEFSLLAHAVDAVRKARLWPDIPRTMALQTIRDFRQLYHELSMFARFEAAEPSWRPPLGLGVALVAAGFALQVFAAALVLF